MSWLLLHLMMGYKDIFKRFLRTFPSLCWCFPQDPRVQYYV